MKQRFIKSGFLFLIVVEWMMRKHIAAERVTSGAKFTTKLNDLDVTRPKYSNED